MNLPLVEKIAAAVLYEGYMLYPYRPSSVKNQQRWTFGGVCPRSYSEAQRGSEVWSVQTECLAQGSADSLLSVRARFLHLLARQVGELNTPRCTAAGATAPAYHPVECLRVDGRVVRAREEATERDVHISGVRLGDLVAGSRSQPFSFAARRDLEPMRDTGGETVGVVVREQETVEGSVEITAECVSAGLFKVGVRINNLTPFADAGEKSRSEALQQSLVSTHAVLGVAGGDFVSMIDPPEELQGVAQSCQNTGLWPVLVGEVGVRDTLLASPIILYDYPQIAPESPGDLFDSTEIDEILTLRILTLSDGEKRELREMDDRAGAILDRTEALTPDALARMHGAMRSLNPLRRGER